MTSQNHPNVIVFFTDQQRWDTCGAHGNPLGLTPNFDRMADEGTHIDASITCQPVCGPARSCLQTGLYATQTGCWRNEVPLDKNLTTIAQLYAGQAIILDTLANGISVRNAILFQSRNEGAMTIGWRPTCWSFVQTHTIAIFGTTTTRRSIYRDTVWTR